MCAQQCGMSEAVQSGMRKPTSDSSGKAVRHNLVRAGAMTTCVRMAGRQAGRRDGGLRGRRAWQAGVWQDRP